MIALDKISQLVYQLKNTRRCCAQMLPQKIPQVNTIQQLLHAVNSVKMDKSVDLYMFFTQLRICGFLCFLGMHGVNEVNPRTNPSPRVTTRVGPHTKKRLTCGGRRFFEGEYAARVLYLELRSLFPRGKVYHGHHFVGNLQGVDMNGQTTSFELSRTPALKTKPRLPLFACIPRVRCEFLHRNALH